MDLGEALQTLTPRLIAYGVARTGSLATAEDVAQEVLLALIRRWQQLGPPASPAAFVFAIAACVVAAVASLLRGGKFHWEESAHVHTTGPESVSIKEAA